METQFASAERSSLDEIKNQSAHLFNSTLFKELFAAVSEIILILNTNRQIVFYNKNLLTTLGIENDEAICGLRPGEVLQCTHAFENTAGCGTTEFCKTCGALNAILSSLDDTKNIQECRVTQRITGDALDLKVKASPLTINEEKFTIFAIIDISNEKRRKILERIFFHDILNTAGIVRSISELIFNASEDELEMFREMLYSGSEKLIEEINMQRDLTAAENNELKLNLVYFDSFEVVEKIRRLYQKDDVCVGKTIQLSSNFSTVVVKSDLIVLSRVIGNLLKNALEASNKGDAVTIGTIENSGEIVFWVHNPVYIPRETQLQIFQRSFSTKGNNRGLGTYSIKLLTEKYLGGKVSFTSDEKTGTTFKIALPLE